MRKLARIIMIMVFCWVAVVGYQQEVQATGVEYYNTVTDRAVDQDGYYIVKADSVDAIIDALAEAKDKATAEQPYKIVVKPSDAAYSMDKAFAFYSNTYLYAQGVTFKQVSGTENNMIRTGDSDSVVGYYYKNITIDGGVWNENKNSNTLAKLAQGENIVIKNATFKNTKTGHLMEIAGVNGLTVDNCTFKDQIIPAKGNKVYEAIQFDLLVKGHIIGYKYQDLATKNVTVTNCTFDNVPRGVGCHTTVLNNPIDGMVISNNTFTNIKSCAIQFMNIVNCTISDNIITNSPRGVTIFGAIFDNQDTYLAKTLSSQGNTTSSTSNSYQKPAENSNIVIENNTITIGGKDPYSTYEKSGILVQGKNVTKTYKSSSGDKIPKGNYYVSGITINNNTVKGNSHGVKVLNTRNCTVSNNTFTFSGSMNKSYYGVQLKNNATKVNIAGNNMTKYFNGIYLKDASAGDITNNVVKDVKKYGISIEESTATNINSNKIEKVKVNAIYVKDGKATNINSNTIKNASKYGISVERSKVSKIHANKVNKTTSNGIHVWDKSTVKTITNNQLTSVKFRGIYVGGKSKVTTIKKNKFKSCKVKMFINPDSKVKNKQKV